MRKKKVAQNQVKGVTSSAQKFALALFGLALALLTIGILETGLRLLDIGGSEEDPFVGFAGSSTLFERKGDAFETRQAKLRFFNRQSFPVKKPEGTRRIFALGGSTVFGRPYNHQTAFPHYLELLLQTADPKVKYEVVNAGGVSYASYRLARLMDEILTYDPDLIILYTGHNEFLEERTYSKSTRLGGALSGLRTAQLMRKAISPNQQQPTQMAEEVKARLDVQGGMASYKRDDALDNSVFEHFSYNLQRMIQKAQKRGVQVLLITPAANVRDFSPFKSEAEPPLNITQQQKLAKTLVQARNLLKENAAAQALELLKGVPRPKRHAGFTYSLGKTHEALGNHQEAKTLLLQAVEEDIIALRARRPIHQAVRAVAKNTNVPLVDLQDALGKRNEQAGGPGLPGDEAFLDHVHLRTEIHQLLAESILEKLADTGWTQASLPDKAQTTALYQKVADGLDPSYQGMRDLNLAKVLGWSGKYQEAYGAIQRAMESLPNDASVFYNAGGIADQLKDKSAALNAYRRAADLDPKHGPTQLQLGKVLSSMGRHEQALEALNLAKANGAPSFDTHYAEIHALLALDQTREAAKAMNLLERESLRPTDLSWLKGELARKSGDSRQAREYYDQHVALDPNNPQRQLDRAVALTQMQAYVEAEQAYKRILDTNPDYGTAHHQLGMLYARTNRLDQAQASLKLALKQEPNNPAMLADLAWTYQQHKSFDRAVELLEKAVQLNPDDATMANDLGVNLGRLGRWSEAAQAFLRAVEAKPTWARAHYNLGQALVMSGRDQEAAPHIDKAMDLGQEIAPGLLKKLAPYLSNVQ